MVQMYYKKIMAQSRELHEDEGGITCMDRSNGLS